MFHITDWFTTMLRLADADLSGLDVDGLDQWDTLQDPSTCASKELTILQKNICSMTAMLKITKKYENLQGTACYTMSLLESGAE